MSDDSLADEVQRLYEALSRGNAPEAQGKYIAPRPPCRAERRRRWKWSNRARRGKHAGPIDE